MEFTFIEYEDGRKEILYGKNYVAQYGLKRSFFAEVGEQDLWFLQQATADKVQHTIDSLFKRFGGSQGKDLGLFE